jgi:pimeloyl-ACP methyl ester carboxylesterase
MGTTYVLVHGSWHGGWCWTPVARRLEERGHRAHAPTLAGHGPGATRAGITHADCVASIARYIEERDLREVVLVGHSFGGTILTQLAPRMPDRVRALVFWSAFVLADGEAIIDVVPPELAAALRQGAEGTPDLAAPMPWEVWHALFMHDAGEEAARMIHGLLTPEPLQPLLEKLDQRAFFERRVPSGYISCRQDIILGHPGWYERFGGRLGPHRHVEIDGSHEACLTRPIELADAIVEATPGR